MNKTFKNYYSWCKYLHREPNLKYVISSKIFIMIFGHITHLIFDASTWFLKRFLPDCDVQQLQLIYISLYLLIWGEASNVRFMPECICYIFHHVSFLSCSIRYVTYLSSDSGWFKMLFFSVKMANDVYGILFSNVEAVSGEPYETGEIIDEETFLRNVITPIYQVIRNVSISRSLMLLGTGLVF